MLDEDEEYIVETTPFGGVRRNHKDYSTTPQIIDYPCKSRADWERIKKRLVPSRDRVDWGGKVDSWPAWLQSDHSIPHNVSLAQYQRVLELVREYGCY